MCANENRHNRIRVRNPFQSKIWGREKKEANLCYLLLFPLKYGDIECGVTWAERTAGAHRLVAHRRVGWVFSRVTSGRLFLRTKTAESGDAHNVSLRSQVLPCASPASRGVEYEELADLLTPTNSLQVWDYTIAETRLQSQRETERDWNCMSREREPSDLAAGSARVAARGA